MDAPPAAAIKIVQSLQGPGFIGVILNIFLYGIMFSQTYGYFTTFRRRDPIWIQLYVTTLFIADTINSVFNIWWLYDIHVNRFGDFQSLERATWLFATDPAMTGLISAMVQLFFAWRVHVLVRLWYLTVFICLLAFCVALGGVGSGVASNNTLVVDFIKYSWIVTPWLICSAVCDVVITVSLTWKLRQRTGFHQRTDDLLNKIIRHTIQNGLVTSIWSTIDLIIFLSDPTALHLAFNYPLAKLYTNTAMSSLNARNAMSNGNGWSDTPEGVQSRDQSYSRNMLSGVGGIRSKHEMFDLRPPQPLDTEVYVNVERHELKDVPIDPKAPATWESEEGSDRKWDSNTKIV